MPKSPLNELWALYIGSIGKLSYALCGLYTGFYREHTSELLESSTFQMAPVGI